MKSMLISLQFSRKLLERQLLHCERLHKGIGTSFQSVVHHDSSDKIFSTSSTESHIDNNLNNNENNDSVLHENSISSEQVTVRSHAASVIDYSVNAATSLPTPSVVAVQQTKHIQKSNSEEANDLSSSWCTVGEFKPFIFT